MRVFLRKNGGLDEMEGRRLIIFFVPGLLNVEREIR